MDDIPKKGDVYSVVVVYQYMSHADNVVPGDFRVVGAEFSGQFVGGFSDDLHAVHQCIAAEFVVLEFLEGGLAGEGGGIVDGDDDVFQPSSISDGFSHR